MMGWTTYSNLEFQLFCYFTDPSYHNCTTYRFDFDVMQGNLALEHIENTMVFLTSPSTSGIPLRSEEHTSELQSRSDLVCRLLLEKKNNVCPTRAATSRSSSQACSVRFSPSLTRSISAIWSVTAAKIWLMPAFCWLTAAAICRTAATFSRVMPESARRFSPDDVTSTMPASILFVLASVRETAVPMELVNSWRIPPTSLVALID